MTVFIKGLEMYTISTRKSNYYEEKSNGKALFATREEFIFLTKY